jgi:hypothetical protein
MTNTILAEFVIAVMVIFELVTVCRRGKTQGDFVVMVFLWRILGIVPRRVPRRVPGRVPGKYFPTRLSDI